MEPQLAACRQVFDLPVQALYVREYQSYECRAFEMPLGDLPTVSGRRCRRRSNMGSGVKALVLLNTQFHLSWQRTSELFLDLYGYSINDHTQEQALSQAYERLAPVEAEIKAQVAASAVVSCRRDRGANGGEITPGA
ncbi:MAG: transposase [Bacteroidia bacterium]